MLETIDFSNLPTLIAAVIVLIVLVPVVIRHADKLKGISITKDGVKFLQPQDNLAHEIPQIDRIMKVKLQSAVDNMQELIRATIDVDLVEGIATPKERKMIQMCISSKILRPLYTTVEKNHLASKLAKRNIDVWKNEVYREIMMNLHIIKDYCDLTIDADGIATNAISIIEDTWVPLVKAILIECKQTKLKIYLDLKEGHPQRQALIDKTQDYLRGLQE